MARALVGFGLDTWYFITADYAFGWSMEENASAAVKGPVVESLVNRAIPQRQQLQ
jgi:hypothetical protein